MQLHKRSVVKILKWFIAKSPLTYSKQSDEFPAVLEISLMTINDQKSLFPLPFSKEGIHPFLSPLPTIVIERLMLC